MIDEGTLASLLAEHAERIPVPAAAVGDLLAASPQPDAAARHRFTRPAPGALAAAAAVIVVAAGTVWALGAHSGSRASSGAVKTAALELSPSTTAAAAHGPAEITRGLGGAGTPSQQDAVPPVVPTSGGTATKTSAAPTDPARVVRTGTLDLRIPRHTFGETIGRITTIAAGSGGFIADEKTYESAAVPSGTVTIRVPSARFNATVERLRALGRVVSASTRGVDVTGQYTDLQARLRATTATRNQYLTVLASATNIGDILAVQDRIENVQTQIEQLQGQINELDNQTTYGTITLSLAEPAPQPKPAVRPHHRSGVSIAWENARSGFSRRVEGIISHSGSALVVLMGLLLIGGALRLLVPRLRRLLV